MYLFSMSAFFHLLPKKMAPATFFDHPTKSVALWEVATKFLVPREDYYPNKNSLSKKKPPRPIPTDRFVSSMIMGTPRLLLLCILWFARVKETASPMQMVCLQILEGIVKVVAFAGGLFCGMPVVEGTRVNAAPVRQLFTAAGMERGGASQRALSEISRAAGPLQPRADRLRTSASNCPGGGLRAHARAGGSWF